MSLSPEMRSVACREWISNKSLHGYESLPPDLMPESLDRMCLDNDNPWAEACTRLNGHTGRHAAGDGTKVVAVWEQR